ncbi:putative transcriptional regulator YdeE [Chryseobacterium sp. H1D6B]|uniref:GyrI-like domain-containing protein n=1 Tax=Chryseobacterium sp. H1D6B TaxID=2940588 RepID=UPI0015CDA9DA|nr:GyrI-like domain-containing protein [Chryseobacterium sp. H1D6B]MDH6250746.1 putative transcriptional regulator YdeE [Chryseobacterium sp. H1D6B]
MTVIKDLKIIGISVRTTNKDNQASQDLGKLWEQFFAENVSGRAPHKLNDNIYTVYTDYKSNYTEEYTAIIGVPVSDISDIPEGLIGREFPAENFQLFTPKGKMPDAVVKTWLDIWKNDSSLNRKYTYDLEVYGKNCQNGDESEVEIFIAVN